jgi:hypothetical protein
MPPAAWNLLLQVMQGLKPIHAGPHTGAVWPASVRSRRTVSHFSADDPRGFDVDASARREKHPQLDARLTRLLTRRGSTS